MQIQKLTLFSQAGENITIGKHKARRFNTNNTNFDKRVIALRVNQVQFHNTFKTINSHKIEQLKNYDKSITYVGWQFKFQFTSGAEVFKPPSASFISGGTSGNPGLQSVSHLAQYLTTFISETSNQPVSSTGYFTSRYGRLYYIWTSTSTKPLLLEFPSYMGTKTKEEPYNLGIIAYATTFPFIEYYSNFYKDNIKVTQMIEVNIMQTTSIILCIGPYSNSNQVLMNGINQSNTYELIPLVGLYGQINQWNNPLIATKYSITQIEPEMIFSDYIDIYFTDQQGNPIDYNWQSHPAVLQLDFFIE